MKTKLSVIFLLFFVIMSNISFGLTSVFSFIYQKNNCTISNTVNIQEQYNMLLSIPKDFIDMCIKVKKDFNILKTKENNTLFFNKNINLYKNLSFISILNSLKLKLYFIYTKTFNKNFSLHKFNNLLCVTLLFFLFYLIKYIGLLRLFNALKFIIQYRKKYGAFLFCLNNI